jgi:hypothetical protein
MEALTRKRCLFHVEREAVARCPECGQFFCRECITEHEDRVICAACLKRIAKKSGARRVRFTGLVRALQCALGVLIAWLFFYFGGRLLAKIPSQYHEGALWKAKVLDEE